MERYVSLLEEQYGRVLAGGNQVNHIIFSGSFSQNYVLKEVTTNFFKEKKCVGKLHRAAGLDR
jgi:hypothetical protein